MRIAYIVTAYKNPDQAVRLVRRLDADDVHVFVHVDQKTNQSDYARILDPLSDSRLCTSVMRPSVQRDVRTPCLAHAQETDEHTMLKLLDRWMGSTTASTTAS